MDTRLADPARQHADRRGGPVGRGCPVRRAAAGDRRRPPRQDHDAGVLVEGRHRLARGTASRATHGTPPTTSGGSSGGSAAAVGLGMGPWSVGTDGGGSVRIPAGVHRHGRAQADLRPDPAVSAEPVRDAVARRADDEDGARHRRAARRDHRLRRPRLVGHADAGGVVPRGLDDGVAGLRIAFSPDLGFVDNDPEVDAAVRAAVDVLADAGRRGGRGRSGIRRSGRGVPRAVVRR